MADVIITDQNFQDQVINSKVPVIVDFWATWCPPCKMIDPILHDLAKEYEGKVIVGKINADENPEAVHQLNVMSLPTVFFFKDGQPIKELIGAQPKHIYQHQLEELLTA